ncbi:MAG: hypothetical protein V3V34_11485 [Kiloniellales bacterium]
MPRLKAVKRSELESFWRAHLDGWRRSDLNQREYCEAHGLPLKRFGDWRAQFKHEDPAPAGKLLYRRGGKPSHMINHMTKEIEPGLGKRPLVTRLFWAFRVRSSLYG